jgi:hypothetical protein
MLYGASFAEEWEKNEKRENKAIFIGKNLDREFITKGFEECKAKPLRFSLGTEVFAKTGRKNAKDGWEKGTVVK